ncbi:hypothetical protein [Paracoccus sp. NSM]|uniref:hypothetical protein n=1 Tax=Paracoccus sp. NSM TaxID=3457784 RepID=UPI004036146F
MTTFPFIKATFPDAEDGERRGAAEEPRCIWIVINFERIILPGDEEGERTTAKRQEAQKKPS